MPAELTKRVLLRNKFWKIEFVDCWYFPLSHQSIIQEGMTLVPLFAFILICPAWHQAILNLLTSIRRFYALDLSHLTSYSLARQMLVWGSKRPSANRFPCSPMSMFWLSYPSYVADLVHLKIQIEVTCTSAHSDAQYFLLGPCKESNSVRQKRLKT